MQFSLCFSILLLIPFILHSCAFVPYNPNWTFNRKIPDNTPLDERSDAVVNKFNSNLQNKKIYLANVKEVPPVYYGTDSDPIYTVDSNFDECRIRMPANAVEGTGSDSPLLVRNENHLDYGQQVELRIWQNTINHSQQKITGNGGGLFHYNNDGKILNKDQTSSDANAFLGYGTGSGLSWAGLITAEEIESGEIKHALRFAYSNCDMTDTYRYPAIATDQPKNCNDCENPPCTPSSAIEMGMRLRLKPSVDCDARTVPIRESWDLTVEEQDKQKRFLKIYCTALRDYGMYVVDGAPSEAIVLMMESNHTANWEPLIGPSDPDTNWNFLVRDQQTPSDGFTRDSTSGIPWDQIQVVQEPFPELYQCNNPQWDPKETQSIVPSEDSYVRGGDDNEDQNFSSDDFLRVKWSSGIEYKRIAIVKFNLSQIDLSSITYAAIQIKPYQINADFDAYVRVRPFEDDWTETDVTFSNLPHGLDPVFCYFKPDVDNFQQIDVLSYLKSLDSPKFFSISISTTPQDGAQTDIFFRSKRSSQTDQMIKLVYSFEDSPLPTPSPSNSSSNNASHSYQLKTNLSNILILLFSFFFLLNFFKSF
ncbi:hypothetical protein M0812_07802 [Anaeramoeba flamelloides]|uniref:Carbohydrate-binding module family 96 domain-containing protein n=1 Tax=Anaeramoeba flamelloides TaxID=1746091 RepID=A0AAV7ZZJ8_9EUKA|nr:hypothetical protein M0812_07802 [Anaeramoeba flamelloides]